MAKKTLIKLKGRPRKPVGKKKLRGGVEVSEGDTLATIMENLGCHNPNSVFITVMHDYYDHGSAVVYANYERSESDAEYQARLEDYRERVRKYKDWYQRNKDLIEKEVARRKEEISSRRTASIRRQQSRLKEELAKLNKQLKS